MKTPEERAAEWIDGMAGFSRFDPLDVPAVEELVAGAIREAVDEAVAAAAPRWIPVAERLPSYKPDGDNTYPVVYPSFIDGRPALFTASINSDGEWVDEHGLNMFWHGLITHWMDLALPDPAS
jgi:hypothetical protein